MPLRAIRASQYRRWKAGRWLSQSIGKPGDFTLGKPRIGVSDTFWFNAQQIIIRVEQLKRRVQVIDIQGNLPYLSLEMLNSTSQFSTLGNEAGYNVGFCHDAPIRKLE
jgi:hypothetical protein